MTVAAVIVTYRTGPTLFDALAAARAARDIDEVIVVDNGNPPEATAWLDAVAAGDPTLRVVRGHGNVGFGRACNLGARQTHADHLLYLNPDAVIAPGAAAALVAAGEVSARPWIAGARLIGSDGREQRGSRRRAPTLGRVIGAFLGGAADTMHLERDAAPADAVAVDAVSGAALMMRAEDFAALGGFDERYFLHAEDLDLCARARAAGGAVMFVPGASVHHVGGTSAASGLFVEWCKGRGIARYLVTFAATPLERAAAVALGPVIVAAAAGRALVRRKG